MWSANHGCAKLWDAIKALFWWIEARQRFSHLADFSQLYKTDWWMSNWAELNFEQFAQYKQQQKERFQDKENRDPGEEGVEFND